MDSRNEQSTMRQPSAPKRRSGMGRLAALLAFALGLAAAPPAEATVSYLSSSSSSWSRLVGFRPYLPGRDLNGVALNGSVLDGRIVERVSLLSAERDGELLSAVWLDGSRLTGLDADGHRIKKGGFVGVTFEATLDDGSLLGLYVAVEEQHPDKVHKDVYGYEVRYEADGGWLPLCGTDDTGEPVLAIPLEGRWSYEQGVPGAGAHIDDPDALTFACEGYVLAKCVTAGYKPWRRVLTCERGQGCDKTSLARHHQACTRALRADYFGDGQAHTTDGTAVNLYDGIGVRTDLDPWPTEAAWDEHGALCVTADHRSSDPQLIDEESFTADGACGAATSSGALLVTETLAP